MTPLPSCHCGEVPSPVTPFGSPAKPSTSLAESALGHRKRESWHICSPRSQWVMINNHEELLIEPDWSVLMQLNQYHIISVNCKSHHSLKCSIFGHAHRRWRLSHCSHLSMCLRMAVTTGSPPKGSPSPAAPKTWAKIHGQLQGLQQPWKGMADRWSLESKGWWNSTHQRKIWWQLKYISKSRKEKQNQSWMMNHLHVGGYSCSQALCNLRQQRVAQTLKVSNEFGRALYGPINLLWCKRNPEMTK